MGILSKILAGPIAAATDYFKRRMELKYEEREHKRKIEEAMLERQIELIKQGLTADATWELEQIRTSGWKDEYVLIVLSIPLIMCFVPGLDKYVIAGFGVLNQTPGWYQWLILIVFSAIFGIRVWRRQQSDT